MICCVWIKCLTNPSFNCSGAELSPQNSPAITPNHELTLPAVTQPVFAIFRTKDDSMEPLSTFRYDSNKNGTLEIRDTRKEDSGSYICWAANSVGKRAITANLDIRGESRNKTCPAARILCL